MIAAAALLALSLGPAACPKPSTAATLPFADPRAVIRTDLDHDGHMDSLGLAAAPFAPGSCGIFLVAKTRRARLAAHVPPFLLHDTAAQSVSGQRTQPPHLAGSFTLDGTRIVAVEIDRGAHANRFALYRFRNGRLIRIRLTRRGEPTVGENYGLTTFGGTYCRRNNTLVEWAGSLHYPGMGRQVDFERRTYRLTGRMLRQLRVERRRVLHSRLWTSIVPTGRLYTPFDWCDFSPK
jgi:hypothetical protein